MKQKIEREGRYGHLKSKKSLRMLFVKVPGGRTVVQFKNRKPKSHRCASCGAVLPGTLRERPFKMQKIAKSYKRPERPFGGFLCSRCSRKKIVGDVRR